MLTFVLIYRGEARWSLWAKAGAVGNGAAVVHGKPAGAAFSRIVHKSTALRSVSQRNPAQRWFCECVHSPIAP